MTTLETLIDALRMTVPGLWQNLLRNGISLRTLERIGLENLSGECSTDEDYLELFLELQRSFQKKLSENYSPDFLLTLVQMYPFSINREEIMNGIEILFTLVLGFKISK